MLQRCENPNCRSYSDYGARGIRVSPEWHEFERFLSDMGLKPPGMQIDRINNDEGYSKTNCRWASPDVQSQNRRSCRLTPESVRAIRAQSEQGASGIAIARKWNVSIATVSMVINRRTWKNV